MPIYDLYSKQFTDDTPNFEYEIIPVKFKVQAFNLISDLILNNFWLTDDEKTGIFKKIYNEYTNELGVEYLNERTEVNFREFNREKVYLKDYFLKSSNYKYTLDFIQISLLIIDEYFLKSYGTIFKEKIEKNTIDLNKRFLENNLGYKYQDGKIFRLDNGTTFSNIIEPTLNVFKNEKFRGASNEFSEALRFYKNDELKSALNECSKSFESTIKIICEEKKWDYNPNDTLKRLVAIIKNNGLIPNYLDDQFSYLEKYLETINTIRNKNSSHGQGSEIKIIEPQLVSYAINITASSILFLISQSKL